MLTSGCHLVPTGSVMETTTKNLRLRQARKVKDDRISGRCPAALRTSFVQIAEKVGLTEAELVRALAVHAIEGIESDELTVINGKLVPAAAKIAGHPTTPGVAVGGGGS